MRNIIKIRFPGHNAVGKKNACESKKTRCEGDQVICLTGLYCCMLPVAVNSSWFLLYPLDAAAANGT